MLKEENVNNVLTDVPPVLLVTIVKNVPKEDLEKLVNVTKDTLKNVETNPMILTNVTNLVPNQPVLNVPFTVKNVKDIQTNVLNAEPTETQRNVVNVNTDTIMPINQIVNLVTQDVNTVLETLETVKNVLKEESNHQNVIVLTENTSIPKKKNVLNVPSNVLNVLPKRPVLNVLLKLELPLQFVTVKKDSITVKSLTVANVTKNVKFVKIKPTNVYLVLETELTHQNV